MTATPHLCSIPSELRLEVIRHLFRPYGKDVRLIICDPRWDSGPGSYWEMKDDGRICVTNDDCHDLACLLRVNKQFYAEARHVLYQRTEVAIYVQIGKASSLWEAFGHRDNVDGDNQWIMYRLARFQMCMSNVTQVSMGVQFDNTDSLSSLTDIGDFLKHCKNWLLLVELVNALDTQKNLKRVAIDMWLSAADYKAWRADSLRLEIVLRVFAHLRNDISLEVNAFTTTDVYREKKWMTLAVPLQLNEIEKAFIESLESEKRTVSLKQGPILTAEFKKLIVWTEFAFRSLFSEPAESWLEDDWDTRMGEVYDKASDRLSVALPQAWEACAHSNGLELEHAFQQIRETWTEYHEGLKRVLREVGHDG